MAVLTFREFEELFARIDRGFQEAKRAGTVRYASDETVPAPIAVPEWDALAEEVRVWREGQVAEVDSYVDAVNALLAYGDEIFAQVRGYETLIRSKVGKPELNARLEQQARAASAGLRFPYSLDLEDNYALIREQAERIRREVSGLAPVTGFFADFGQDYVQAYARILAWYDWARGLLPFLQAHIDKRVASVEGETRRRLDQIDSRIEDARREALRRQRAAEEAAAEGSRREKEEAARRLAAASERILKTLPSSAELKAVPRRGLVLPAGTMELDLSPLGSGGNVIRRAYGLSSGAGTLSIPCYAQAEDLTPMVLMTGDDTTAVQKLLEPMILSGFLSRVIGGAMLTVCSASGANVDYAILDTLIRAFPEVTHGRIFSGRRAAEEILKGHASVMQSLLHGPLAGGKRIQDYNMTAERKIPVRYLLLTGFPMNFSAEMLAQTANLVRDGGKCGIRLLIQYDRSAPVPAGSDAKQWIEKILQYAVVFDDQGTCLQNRKISLLRCRPAAACDLTAVKKRIRFLYEEEQKKKNRTYGLDDILPRTEYLKGDAAEMLEIPFAVTEDGGVCSLRMGDKVANGTSHFALMIGPTGSGKSVTLHTLITTAMMKYRPSELQMILMDFKEGTEFKIYENYKLPNLQFIAVDSVQQFGESILARLCRLIEERAEIFRKASLETGMEIKNLPDFRRAGKKMARILVVVDEFQVLFNMAQDRKCAMRAASHFGELISKARSYGIHFIMATQTLHKISSGDYSISKASMEEMHIRIALQCTEKEMVLVMGDKRGRACMDLLSGQKGSLVYLENDLVGSPTGARSIYIKPDLQQRILADLEKLYSRFSFRRARVFRGAEMPEADPSVLAEWNRKKKALLLGEPIAIGDPVSIDMTGMNKKNLLVLGENVRMERIITDLLISQIPALAGKLWLMDGEALQTGEEGLYALARRACAGTSCDLKTASNLFRVVPMVREAYQVYLDRKGRMARGEDTASDKVPLFILVRELQLIEPMIRMMENQSVEDYDMETEGSGTPAPSGRKTAPPAGKDPFADLMAGLPGAPPAAAPPDPEADLRAEIGDMMRETGALLGGGSSGDASGREAAADLPAPYKQLHTLIDSGYMCGIHVCMTCGDYSALAGIMSKDLNGFSNRIAMKTASPKASVYVSTDINPAMIRDNMVLYSDGRKDTLLMRPYVTKKA